MLSTRQTQGESKSCPLVVLVQQVADSACCTIPLRHENIAVNVAPLDSFRRIYVAKIDFSGGGGSRSAPIAWTVVVTNRSRV